MENYFKKHNLIWTKMPSGWEEAPFLGNGMLGCFLCSEDKKRLKMEIGRNDVCDHRENDKTRLPIGYFLFGTSGEIKKINMELDIYNAVLNGKLETEKGTVDFKIIVHTDNHAIICEINTDEGEKDFSFEYKAHVAQNLRNAWGKQNNADYCIIKDYVPNPPSTLNKTDDISYCTQKLLCGGETVTAWTVKKNGLNQTLYSTICHSYPEENALKEAISNLDGVKGNSFMELYESHVLWWNNYYKKSFVSIPDGKLESFYWIQLYKIASATRKNYGIVDNQGPWLILTPWPKIWFNLNVQLVYWLTYTSNHIDLAESLTNSLLKNIDNLIENVPEEYRFDSAAIGRAASLDLKAPVEVPGKGNHDTCEAGNLTWLMHNCFLHYRMTMDERILKDVVYPILRRTINFYIHFLYKDENGKYNLPPTSSPEYLITDENCNYDISLIKWGVQTLLYAVDKLNIKDELIPKWKDIDENLIDYPEDENGFMIAKNTPYAKSHRHYSHLLMIYPLYLINVENKGDKERIKKSLLHWQSMKEQLQGYSYTGASSISSAINDGDSALMYLNGLFTQFLKPNTMYREGGPVIETPLSGAQCIHDMLLQSFKNKIRIFPAVPTKWKDVVFDNLRAEGAFSVSAKMENGECQFFKIKSLAGEPCIIKCKNIKDFIIKSERELSIEYIDSENVSIDLKKDETVIFHKKDVTDFEIKPVKTDEKTHNSFGLK